MSELRTALADALGPLYRIEREVRPVGEYRLFVATQSQNGSELLVKILPAALSLGINDLLFERAWSSVYWAAMAIDADDDERRRAVHVAKSSAGEAARHIAKEAIQMHGGSGITRDLPFERMYRDQRGYRITEGGSEVQRWVIARGLIKKYMAD